MNAQSASLSTNAAGPAKEGIRKAELGPALKRNRLLQRVMAAGRRLPQNSRSTRTRLR